MNDNFSGPMISPELRLQAINLHNQGVLTAATDKPFAYKMLCSSVEVDPTFHQGWFQVGCANADMGLLAGAVAAFRRVLELDPLSGKTLVNIGHRMFHLGRVKEARKFLERAAEIDPTLAFAWCNLSLVESVETNMKKSIALSRKAFDMQKDPIIETALALTLMMGGHYAEGLKHFEARFPYKLQQFLSYPQPQWHGDDIRDKTLFIQAEQGMGDTLSFIRFFPAVAERAGSIVAGIQPELMRLFQMMLAPWKNITLVPIPCPFPPADFWTTTTSLPVALGLTNDEIINAPNLPLPDLRAPAPWKAPGRKLHIGICWAGAPGNDIDRFRSMKVEQFLELYRVSGIQLYSLQVGDRVIDLHNAGAATLVKDLAPFIRDVTDTIAIINELDLIITVETALGHICGAMGRECWVLVSKNGGDWRLGRAGNKSLWNPKHRLFRQGPDAEWGPVLDQVVAALQERVAG